MTSTTLRRSLATLGVGLALGVSAAAPVSARQEPGPRPSLPYGQEVYENHYLPSPPSEPQVQPVARFVQIDDGAVEYVQVGAGALAGVALFGAGLAVASRRSHAHAAHPA